MDVMPHDITYHTNDMERRAGLSLHKAANQEDLDNQTFAFLNRDDIGRILESKKRIKKNSEMFQLVNGYFKKSACTSDFFTALVPSLKEACDFIELAIKSSDAADEDDQPLRTLDELRQYFFVGSTGEFESVYQEQLPMLGELQNQKVEHERKLKSVKIWRKVSCIIFVSVFAALFISAFVVALKASPRVAAEMVVTSSIPVGSMGKWFDSMLKDYQDALKADMKLINTMLD